MMNDFDDIDRALFALPLEAPPADLRERILAATVRAPRAVSVRALRPIDFTVVALLLIACAGTTFASITVPGFAATISSSLARSGESLGNPMLWLWLAAGGSVAAWISLIDFAPRTRVRS